MKQQLQRSVLYAANFPLNIVNKLLKINAPLVCYSKLSYCVNYLEIWDKTGQRKEITRPCIITEKLSSQ
jgi:hypothetical protein